VDKATTIQKFFALGERKDWAAIGEQLIGEGYCWIDHTVGTVSRTPRELSIATAEDDAWEDVHLQIDHLTEGADGRVFVQMTRTATLPKGSEWRGVQGSGQTVTRKAIDIITFALTTVVVWECQLVRVGVPERRYGCVIEVAVLTDR
jgi:hypothetical protein